MTMLKFNKNLFNNIILKFFSLFKLWSYFLKKIIKFNFFLVNFFLYKNFLLYFRLLNQGLYTSNYLKINNELIKRQSLVYYISYLPKHRFGSWSYYLKWINAYI